MNECGERYGASCWSTIINIDGDEALRSTAIFRLAMFRVYTYRSTILKYVCLMQMRKCEEYDGHQYEQKKRLLNCCSMDADVI